MRVSKLEPGKRAFSLMEAVIVLAVVALVLGGIWGAAAKIRDRQRAAAAYDGVIYMFQRVKKVFSLADFPAGTSCASTDITSTSYRADVFPKNWPREAGWTIIPTGGRVSLFLVKNCVAPYVDNYRIQLNIINSSSSEITNLMLGLMKMPGITLGCSDGVNPSTWSWPGGATAPNCPNTAASVTTYF